MKKRVFHSIDGKTYTCKTHAELAKFILFVVETGKVRLRGAKPRLRTNNPSVKKLLKIKKEHFNESSALQRS